MTRGCPHAALALPVALAVIQIDRPLFQVKAEWVALPEKMELFNGDAMREACKANELDNRTKDDLCDCNCRSGKQTDRRPGKNGKRRNASTCPNIYIQMQATCKLLVANNMALRFMIIDGRT